MYMYVHEGKVDLTVLEDSGETQSMQEWSHGVLMYVYTCTHAQICRLLLKRSVLYG